MIVDDNKEKTYKRIVFTKGFSAYRDHEAVPIEGVAEALGIDLKREGGGAYKIKCPCPDHADNNPSAVITTAGRYENTFKCWSCNEGGGPLELVMAINSGITPSKYWKALKNKGSDEYKEAIKARNAAAEFINDLYPGLIHYEKVNKNGQKINENKEELKRPDLPFKVWDELKNWMNIDRSIGLKKKIFIRNAENNDIDKEYKVLKDLDALDDYSYASILYEKLNEVQDALREYKNQILSDFPYLNSAAKAEIILGIKERTDSIEDSAKKVREYLVAVQDRDYPAEDPFLDFDDEEFDGVEKE